jgi:predicted glutamine amidotransferase
MVRTPPAGVSGTRLIYADRVQDVMCRLFGLLTAEEETALPWLATSPRSLLAQSNVRPEVAQRDGWGIGWYEGRRTRVEKGVTGAFENGERERFLRAANDARPPLVVGHLRHASNPLGVTRGELLGLVNSQPFETHTVLFAHNGSIPFPRETRPYLGVHERDVKGINDSEVLFWLLERHVEETRDPLRGYFHAVDDLLRVWNDVGRPSTPPYSGLNVLYARGQEELWAFCAWTGDHGTGLFETSRPYYEMTYQATPHHVVVGSEPFDSELGAWTPIPRGTYLRARRDGRRIDVTTGPIPMPPALEPNASFA